MLKSLDIENIAIIEKASVDFSEGLNVLTGETGAGKSILIDSINAVTGEKTSRELVRSGENSAFVSALFENISPEAEAVLKENMLPAEPDGSLLLQRKLSRDGKNICRVNGVHVTVSVLRSIGSKLINIHGQRDSQALLNPSEHLHILDLFAENSGLCNEYKAAFYSLGKTKKELDKLKYDEAYKARKLDILSFQINELRSADIKIGEREELHKKKTVQLSTEKLIQALAASLNFISGDENSSGAYDMICTAAKEISAVSALANGLEALTEALENAASAAENAGMLIEEALNQLSRNDADPEQIDERLDLLYRLSKKYGQTEEEMLEFLHNAEAEYYAAEASDELAARLEEKYRAEFAEASALAEKLSSARQTAAERLSKAVESELSFLNMASCRFIVRRSTVPLNDCGKDSVEFYISANAGETEKPLNKVASGGELSRIMLALKNVLNTALGAETLIFDEIDTGVSGAAARAIAVKLSQVSRRAQVILITHLAQIAAFADEHMYLYKEERGERTFTQIKPLTAEERAQELARISYGGKTEQVHINAVRQMLENADEIKSRL